MQGTIESGYRLGFDDAKKCKVTMVHLALDTLGHLLAVLMTPASEQDRTQVKDLCFEVQEAFGTKVELAYAGQGYNGQQTALEATEAGVELVVLKRPKATKGFILLLRRRVVERSFAWLSRFKRLGRDLERIPSTLVSFHVLAACIMLCNNRRPLFA